MRLVFVLFFQGHYSMKKGIAFIGLGIDNLISVKSDSKGKMDIQDLENKILQAQSEVILRTQNIGTVDIPCCQRMKSPWIYFHWCLVHVQNSTDVFDFLKYLI